MALSSYEKILLEGWEDNYKKSQLTFWIMLALKDSSKHMKQIKSFINARTLGTISADDKSMYRALRRLRDADLVQVGLKATNGPDLKIYKLTAIGSNVLDRFITRNIKQIYYQPEFKRLLN